MLDQKLRELNALLTKIDETNSTVEAEVAAQEQRVKTEQDKLASLKSLVRMISAPVESPESIESSEASAAGTREKKRRKYVRKPKQQGQQGQDVAVQSPAEA
jgi:L-serine deaminase